MSNICFNTAYRILKSSVPWISGRLQSLSGKSARHYETLALLFTSGIPA